MKSNPPQEEVTIHTKHHRLKAEVYFDVIETSRVKVDKKLFTEMCRTGCSNYNNKYCCPPHSPEFTSHIGNHDRLLLVMVKIDLDQLAQAKYKEYHKVRMTNTIIKSRIEKVMRSLEGESGTKFMSTGACRLCKPCQKKLSRPCKHPQEMRFSLEALGADCNKLAQDAFGKPLLWYEKKHAPAYTAVICALPLKAGHDKSEFYKLLGRRVDEIVK